jgi:hypothetical protein
MPLNQIWKLLYPHWKKPAVELIPGYTIMILVPGDLPFFLKIALETCAKQDPESLVETLVVPDNRLQTGFVERMEEWAENYSISPVPVGVPKSLRKTADSSLCPLPQQLLAAGGTRD